MNQKWLKLWLSFVNIILIFFGISYLVFGLKILPVPRSVLLDWETVLYGAIMTGWGMTLFLVGRIAFERKDDELKRALFAGIATWLIIEAIFSAKLGVWFDVGVDGAVLILFSIPLLKKHL